MKKPTEGDCFKRALTIEKRAIDEEARTVEVAFSSETPVDRWYGREILVHDTAAVRLDRMRDGAAVLINHDMNQHVGVVESARIDSDRVGRAVVRFASDPESDRHFRKMVEGVLTKISVGYRIHAVEERYDADVTEVRMTDWEPYEISFVAVPADASVGAGRSLDAGQEVQTMDKSTEAHDVRDNEESPIVGDGGQETRTTDVGEVANAAAEQVEARQKAREAEVTAIRDLGERYNLREAAATLVDTDGTLDDMKAAVRNSVRNAAPKPVGAATAQRIEGARPRYKALRAFKQLGEEAAYRCGMWARAHVFGDEKASRWLKDNHQRVMTSGELSAGGVLVPDEMSQAIVDLREQFGVIRRIARVVPMGSDTLTVPRRVSGLTAYFVGQEDATTESEKAWNQVQLVARELSALSRFSRVLAEDAVIDVGEDLAMEMAYAFAEKEDDCALNGDGTSTYGGITGIRTKLIDADHTAGIVTGAAGIDTYAEMDSADLDSVRALLPEYASMNPMWLMSKTGKNLVIDPILAAGGGNTKTDLGGRLVDSYLGDPVMVSQKMPTSSGDLSDVVMALYGDFSMACTLGDRSGFSIQVLNERYAEFRQIGVLACQRFDFVAHDLGDTSNAGPVVGFVGE